MKNLNALLALGLFGVTGSALAQDANSFDVLGIKIGMTREQAEKKLKGEFPALQLVETSSYRESPGVQKTLARLKFYSERMTVFLHFTPLTGKVFSIYRIEHIGDRYKPETWTPFETLQKAFDKKYGAPTFISPYGPVHFVVFDKNGTLTKAKPCNESQIPRGFSKTDERCGVELAYKWRQGGSGQQYKGFADGLEMTLTDHSMVNDEMKNVDMKADEINKQKREQSVGNKAPKL
jgi:hypothetical protein